jgi:hypothetical protein
MREDANDLRDPEHLVAVLASANRQKGSKAPDTWLPSNEHYRCAYVTDWIAIKKRWALTSTEAEARAVAAVLAACIQR